MSTDLVTLTANDLVAMINAAPGGTFTPSFTATVEDAPVDEMQSYTAGQPVVMVVPAGDDEEFLTRKTSAFDVEVDLVVTIKLVKPSDETELNTCKTLVRNLREFLKADAANGTSRRKLANGQSLTKIVNKPMYSVDMLRTKQLFRSILMLTYSRTVDFR